MKFILFVSFFYSINLSVQAQDYKRNHNWVLGFMPVVTLDFNSSTILMDSFNNIALMSSSCISNTNGDLELFSSGFVLLNKDGNIIDNGLDVNSPYGTILANHASHYSPYEQTSIILPKKGNQYYVFSTGISDTAFQKCQQNLFCVADVLNYSVVDMDSNAGKGKVVLKNKVILDNQTYTNLATTAVRHGNGVDWWLVKVDCYHKQIQTFWVQSDTILGPFFHPITDTANYQYIYGTLYFSPDGTKFAHTLYNNLINGQYFDFNRIDLYDFNRCTGEFSYRNHYLLPVDTVSYSGWDIKAGICFSPDSKLLYVSNNFTIYQIEVEDTNSQNALFIHGPDTSLNYFPWYHLMACGPDGRLYIGNFNGTRQYMSYIEYPNVKGLGCNFIPQGLWQPYTNLLSPPNMPNYGLGVDTANGCWPLSGEGVSLGVGVGELVVYPNPASSKLEVRYEIRDVSASEDKRNANIEMYNTIGQRVHSSTISNLTSHVCIDVSRFAKGVYYLKCGIFTKKIIIE